MVLWSLRDKVVWGVLIFSSILLLILTPLALRNPQNEITGKAIEAIDSEDSSLISGEMGCTDSDSGLTYSLKGKVSYCISTGCSNEVDSCSGKRLKEWYCKSTEKNYEEHDCEYDCDNGACISLITKHKYAGGSSGGGGGGGSGTSGSSALPVTDSGQIYDLGALNSETTLEIVKGDSIGLDLGSNRYTLILEDNTPAQATIISGSQAFSLNIRESTNIDLNGDNASDVYVLLRSINLISKKVKLTLRSS